jgi:hypothetical protein
LGNIGGRSFLRAFEIKRYIKTDVKMPCRRVSLSIGAPLGNLEGIRLPGLFFKKKDIYNFNIKGPPATVHGEKRAHV